METAALEKLLEPTPADVDLSSALLAYAGQGEAVESSVELADQDGVPRKMFIKDLIHNGNFKHQATGQLIPVSGPRLNHWAKTYNEMANVGLSVGLPLHTHKGENGGWVRGMWVDGSRLMGKLEAIGQDAITAVARNKVSIKIVPAMASGEGHQFSDAIQHVAIVPDPVINGQGEAIAASQSSGCNGIVPICIMPASEDNPKQGNSEMEIGKLLAAMMAAGIDLSIKADETPEKAVATLLSHTAELEGKVKGHAVELKAKDDKVVELQAAVNAGKVVELSTQEKYYATSAVDSKIGSLVESGKMTPAHRDAIKPLLEAPVMLSIGEGSTKPTAMAILDTFEKNEGLKKPGTSVSGGQEVTELSRDEQNAADEKDKVTVQSAADDCWGDTDPSKL